MPQKTNDKNEIIDKIEDVVSTIKSKVVKKESTSNLTSKTTSKAKNSASTKIPNSKKTAHNYNSIEKKGTKTEKSAVTSKSKNVARKRTASTTKTASKSTTSKKSTTKKPTSKTQPIVEYYDLPYRYNQTIVKILAQTPKMLFVYWDIAEKDREKYKQYYGEDFFTASRPVLIIHNETMNYSFELEINDFANSWYIKVNDANCKYNVELGRRPNYYITTLKENYVYISSSNLLDAPNDHILFEQATPNIKYKNVKNNQINIKDFSNSAFIKKILQTYSVETIEELYEKLYEKDLLEDFKNGYYKNPSSNPSSNFI